MLFKKINFSSLNEADIREEIIAPLLRNLGYQAGTENDIIREQSLRYPRAFLGRKDAKKDPPLRGKADYICEVNNLVRWVIEAKQPNIELGFEEIEQAYSYANHPEIRAVYFCISNGLELRIYQTNLGPNAEPLIFLKYEEFENSFEIIKNLVGPEALLRDYLRQTPDVGQPIGPGLRSVVRILGGHFIYKTNTLNNPALNGLTINITDGAVERDEQNKLVAFIKTLAPFEKLQHLNEKLGLDRSEFITNDSVLSTDKNYPTVFQSQQRTILPAGERVLDMTRWQDVVLPYNITCDVKSIASGILINNKFLGAFTGNFYYQEFNLSLVMEGDFEAHLA